MFMLFSTLMVIVVDFVEDKMIHHFVEKLYFHQISGHMSDDLTKNSRFYQLNDLPKNMRDKLKNDEVISEEFPFNNGSMHLYYNPSYSTDVMLVDVDENELKKNDYISLVILLFFVFIFFLLLLLFVYKSLYKRIKSDAQSYLCELESSKDFSVEMWKHSNFEEVHLAYEKIKELTKLSPYSSNEFISHEIRNHLTVISSSSQMINRFKDDEDIKNRYIERIKNETEKLNLVTNSVLELTRGKLKSNQIQRELEFEEVRSVIFSNEELNSKTIRLSFFSSPKISIPSSLLKLLIQNLMRNSARASSNKGIIDIIIKDYHISVVDNGSGFIPGSTPKGHGIGLNLVKDICSQHDVKFTLKNRMYTGGGCVASIIII